MSKRSKIINGNLYVASFQEKWIKKRVDELKGSYVDYIYALIQEDITKHKHNPLRVKELKQLSNDFKFFRTLNMEEEEK